MSFYGVNQAPTFSSGVLHTLQAVETVDAFEKKLDTECQEGIIISN